MKKTRRKKILLYSLLTILILVIGLGVAAYLRYYPVAMRVKSHAQSLLTTVSELNQMVDEKDVDIIRARALIGMATQDVDAIRTDVKPYYPLIRRMKTLPRVGGYAGQVEPGLEYAHHMLSAANLLLPITDVLTTDQIYSNRSSRLIQVINEQQPEINQAKYEYKKAVEYYHQINPDLFPAEYQSKITKLKKFHPLLEQLFASLELVPSLTGAEKPITYLVILQNSDELRPTGGFITSFGLIRLEKGVVTLLDFTDSTESSYMSEAVPAPDPLREILLAHYWLPRDGNWSPAFPESAQKVQELYYLSTGIKTDGVIAMHQASIAHLLQFTGPIKVNGDLITVENVYDYMIQEKMEAIISGNATDRKDFIEILVRAILDQLPSKLSASSLPQFAKLMQDMANSGELLAYANDSKIQQAIIERHLDGDLHPGDADYLMVVDANIGYSKLDHIVTRSLVYTVDLSKPTNPSAQLQVTYQNPSVGNVTCRQGGDQQAEPVVAYMPPSCYWNFWRVYSPAGTTIHSKNAPAFPTSFFLEGYSWPVEPKVSPFNSALDEISGLMVVPVNSTQDLSITRSITPAAIQTTANQITYQLRIQKQPGITNLPVQLHFIVPAGYESASEAPTLSFDIATSHWQLSDNITNLFTDYRFVFIKK